MSLRKKGIFGSLRLIETWDVLKSWWLCLKGLRQRRLIETWDVLKLSLLQWLPILSAWLIETWDVLKFHWNTPCESERLINRNMGCIEILRNFSEVPVLQRLIETWDVLKFGLAEAIYKLMKINRNMGCIEMELVFP